MVLSDDDDVMLFTYDNSTDDDEVDHSTEIERRQRSDTQPQRRQQINIFEEEEVDVEHQEASVTNSVDGEEHEEEEEEVDSEEKCQENKENKHEEAGGNDGSISVTLTDPGVLDCPICYEPFYHPVSQVFFLFKFLLLHVFLFLRGQYSHFC